MESCSRKEPCSRRRGAVGIGVLAAASMASVLAHAKPAPSGHPDLAGPWVIEPDLVYSLIPADGHNVPVQRWAYDLAVRSLEAAKQGRAPIINNRLCLPLGRAREMQGVWPFMILQTPKQLTFLMEEGSRYYVVDMNQDHPKALKPNWNGNSVGHWEGSTLVVDTVGMNDKTDLVANKRTEIRHTESLHLVERFRLIDGGRKLEDRATIDDPKAFTRPFDVVTVYDHLKTGDHLLEQICSQNFVDFETAQAPPSATAPPATATGAAQ